MKKHFIIGGMFLLVSSFTFGQIGINTANPQGAFHIDGQKNNPATGVPNTTEQSDDYVVTANGNVGIGLTNPTAKLEVNSGTAGVSGLKFDNINNSTSVSSNLALLGVDAAGNVATAAGTTVAGEIGDVKNSFRTADYNGWYLLNGRAISTLSASAQAAAATLGFTTNLPDATDRVLKTKTTSENLGITGGFNTLTLVRANLPNFNFAGTISGTALSNGAHTHTPPAGAFLLGGTQMGNNGTGNFAGNAPAGAWGGIGASANTASAGGHTHTLSGTASVPSGGTGTPLDNRSPYLVVNTYVYLGL
ncbi:hypothetical protein A0O34_00405 [Chryseobacterium glaciei]|uniref:Phage tail collar domain-containing protein n=1 Tax=Chryseobacterium glaciei TaxID=1685010 RepID=A0A172XQ02_9FLAO|nr:hypothetical protein [Chryseobacterium glaciei]ANF49107.1 hypothetical protein A0O34_00405 [Chryseobacterium glaciei]